jgi:superoxide reductase
MIPKAPKVVRTNMRNSTQPKFILREPRFFRCDECGALFIYHQKKELALKEITPPVCCGKPMRELIAQIPNEDDATHKMKLTIAGGFAANAAIVEVGGSAQSDEAHPKDESHRIEWFYLYTFLGGQLKYLKTGLDPKIIFALSQEDAFVYCDRATCKPCKFNCKRGFTAYAYCNQHGLFKVAM